MQTEKKTERTSKSDRVGQRPTGRRGGGGGTERLIQAYK